MSRTSRCSDRKNRINGRNNYGQLTVRHRGGGNKKHYRMIDFRRDKIGIPAKVETIEYDPNRSAFIALVELCRWRTPLHSSAGRAESRHVGGRRAGSGYPCRQFATVEKHSARHDGSQHRTSAWQGRADGAQRRRCRAVGCERRRLRSRQAAVRRSRGWSMSTASRPSARSAIWIMRMSRSEKPAARGTWVFGRQFAVS